MTVSLYRERLVFDVGPRCRLLSNSAPVFAEVVVDIPARELGDRLFTYRVPDYLRAETFIGAQVLVPFGTQELVGGYVVAISDSFSGNFALKDVVDVLDNDPLFDRDYVEFLHWVADYYCAGLSSVISAAVPADFGPRLKRVVELVSERAQQQTIDTAAELIPKDNGAHRILEILSSSRGGVLSLRTLRQRCRMGQAPFYKALAFLRQAKEIRLRAEPSAHVGPKTVTSIVWTGESGGTARQEQVISVLRRAGGQLPLARLLETAATTHNTVKRMVAAGLLQEREEEVLRDPMERVSTDSSGGSVRLPVLTPYQSEALKRLSSELAGVLSGASDGRPQEVQPFLLHGVTGSGKTEIYLRLIQQVLDRNRSALLLVPEISLTPQLAGRLKSRFGRHVAVWHSALSVGERYDTWRRLRCRDVRVLLGARSAVLASMPDLGLIILDEEHDGSYKQSSPSPRYHAGRLALEKARRLGAMVLLGSATPDVATYYQAQENGRLVCLPERVFQQAMPEVQVVDMRTEFLNGNRSIFSLSLSRALAECLERKEQAILLMNRRGYASHVFCRACGYVIKCNHCSVSMVLHQTSGDFRKRSGDGHLACHHCGFTSPAGVNCPNCSSPFLRQYGLGTQRVEQEIERLFETARTIRLDADIASRRGAMEEVFEKFSSGEADILIGTQMVAKGLDIPAVTLVGVLAADAAFNLPDYRSAERGFQLLTQVSGRAGRGDRPGRVVLQTYDTDMPALRLARNHDYVSFAGQELASRRELQYPPFSQIVRVVVAGPEAYLVEAACEQLAEELTHFLEEQVPLEAVKILGPAACLIERLRGNFRYHLLVKNLAGEEGRSLVAAFFRSKRLRPGLQMSIDVDALDLL